ncbi:MAG: hypothetical protein K2K25_12120 [Muribaculaceae bacterium]|nr:hypothetical protein [Muribaculaceae bacterium]
MQTKQILTAITILLLTSLGVMAQRNTLSNPNIIIAPGGESSLQIELDNSSEVVAVQFTINLPESISLGEAATTERTSSHIISSNEKFDEGSHAYTCILMSPNNSAISGHTGSIMSIQLYADENLKEGTVLQPSFSDVAIVARDGSNIATGFSNGNIMIGKSPDLEISNVATGLHAVNPGDLISVGWVVTNVGGLKTNSGWSEQIILIGSDGTEKVLASSFYNDPLNAGGRVSRNAEIKVPDILGIDGNAQICVKLTPNSDAGEPTSLKANNTAYCESFIQIGKKLTLSPESVNVEETSNSPIRFFLTRSGNTSSSETFVIEKIGDSRFSVPSEVTIHKGQSGVYVYMNIKANSVLDDSDQAIINISGNGYSGVESVIHVEDDTYPSLSMSFSNDEVTEGDDFDLIITANRPPKENLDITIACELPGRFIIPSITLPAGESEVRAKLTAKDDDVPDVTRSVMFTVAADMYSPASVILDLLDDDVPSLQFSITPDAISESSGPVSVIGKLLRNDNFDKTVTIRFSDDSDGNIYYGRESVEMASGVKELTVNLGPIDNSVVDGERTYNITASVWISSCSCNASNGSSGGQVSVPLTVYDDDGPALSMVSSASVIKEGNEMTVTVSRNTDSSGALTVYVSCDSDSRLEFPSSVLIPAGATSGSFKVKSLRNEEDNDDFTAVLTVEAEGFAKGNLWFLVSDQTLPDAQISEISVSENEIKVGERISLNATLINTGSYMLPELTKVFIYRKGDVNPLAIAYLQSELMPDERVIIEKTITLPDAVGSYSLYAVVNEEQEVKELLYSNNTSPSVEVNVKSPFSFRLKTDKAIYNQNEEIHITGSIKGVDVGNKNVDIYVINEGIRQVLKAVSDKNGAFDLNYQPYSEQMGHFEVGACYPGENTSNVFASFDVYGIKRTISHPIFCEITYGEDFNGIVGISNPGNLPLTDLQAKVISKPENCSVQLECPSEIQSGASAELSYKIVSPQLSSGNDWQKFVVELTSKEGASLTVPVNYYCYNAGGKIQSSVAAISTTMMKDGVRDYPFEISNIGKGATGKITLALPTWMSAATPTEMASLNNGETATVVLRFVPTNDMQLNVPVTGQIGINCENGDGLALPFTIEPVSEANGILTVDVCDEYTYYTSEAPHVSNAEVRISHPTTGVLIASGLTDENGRFSTSLNEGYYAVSVNAPHHDTYRNYVLVDPASEKCITVNLSIEAITVGWNVEETEVEDEYRIVTTVKFETNVPAPVVEMQVPDRIPAKDLAEGESLIFNAVLTNKGLITAQDVQFIAPDGFTYLTFEPLSYSEPFSLAPQQSVAIPIKVTHVKNNGTMRVRPIDDDPCVGKPGTLYAWDCGTDRKWHRYSIPIQVGSCNSNDSTTWDNSGNGSYGGRGGNWYPVPHTGFGGDSYGPSSDNNNVPTLNVEDCEPCQNKFFVDLLDCILELVPGYKELKIVIACVQKVIDAVNVAQNNPTKTQLCLALMDAVSSCTSAKGAGSGDKNQGRAKQREEALAEILGTLKGIADKVQNEEETNWEEQTETLVSLAQSLSKLAGYDFDDLGDLICPLKLLEPCDKEGTDTIPAKIKALELPTYRNTEPSYIQEFRNALTFPFLDQISLLSMQYEFYGDACWLDSEKDQLSDFFDVFYSLQDEEECIPESSYDTLIAAKPENVSKDQVRDFIDRWNNSLRDETSDNCINYDNITKSLDIFDAVDDAVSELGYDSFADYFEVEYDKCRKEAESIGKSVCSSITLQFSQSMVMTRQAFRGTLTVFNGHETTAMSDVKLSLTIKDEMGNLATTHEFQINPESISGFEGNLDLTGGWSLAANETGTATILFIPTKYAAPTVSKVYSFGGTLTYVDPFNGLEVSRILSPVYLTVKPSPNLDLTYFMQRDILGDDPLTEDVESSEEAEFSLLITNTGYGDAQNVKMVTDQPKIIENEKGLLIDFELTSSQLNGGEKTLALGNSVTSDFGTIPAKGSAYAQWWIKSSLLGHFSDYNVDATHISSSDNPDLSLLNNVAIHELIRSIDIDNGDGLKGFMTNDIIDAEDMPDMLYFSNGEIAPVITTDDAELFSNSETEYILSISPDSEGWNYGRISDPTFGRAKLKKILRQSDGKEISLRNIWQTDRTLRDGKEPVYENLIHFVDDFKTLERESYLLTFEPIPLVRLEIEAVEGLPDDNSIVNQQVEILTVVFNKPIDSKTFTYEDISLSIQGFKQDVSLIEISTDDNKSFQVNLSEIYKNAGTGFYSLTFLTSGIIDSEGFTGKDGKTVNWIYMPDGSVSITVNVYPEDTGYITHLIDGSDLTISPSSVIPAKYGDSITLTAHAKEGYDFEEWINKDNVYSTDERIEFIALSNDEFIAQFSPKSYYIEIDAYCKGGSILGRDSGIYYFGEELPLIAVPDEGYVFYKWIINGEEISENSVFTYKVKEETRISASFIESSGVEIISEQNKIIIYSIDGLLINDDATLETIQNLEKGVYIINGVKYIAR